jgi:hypothetical protein
MRRLGVIVVAAALLCAGCRVDAVTTIRVDEDGSGAVSVRIRLDAEAVRVVERGGKPLAQSVVLTDLRDAGWRISRWLPNDDGSAVLRLVHPFANQQELATLLEQLGGRRDGPLRDVELVRERGMFQSKDGVNLVADLRGLRTGVQDDEQLSAQLAAAGIDVAAVDAVLQQQLRRAFNLRVILVVPGDKTRTFAVEAGERQSVALATTKIEGNRLALVAIGAMLVFLALLLYLSASISARRRRSREIEFAAARARRGSQPVM